MAGRIGENATRPLVATRRRGREGKGPVHPRLQLILVTTACLVGACGDSGSASEPAPPSTTIGAVTTSGTPSAPSSTMPLSLGGYNVTPIRSDGQRVTFRITLPDEAVGEASFAPIDTTISYVEPSIELLRPGGQPAGGGGIFTAAESDPFFVSYCANSLGGNCTPKSSESLADGNRLEAFTRTDGVVVTRVVFGPWAMFVQGREIADAFIFRGGPDGFPVVHPRAAGFATTNPYLRVYTNHGPPYLFRSNPSGACTEMPRTPQQCDRGLSVESVSTEGAPIVRRIG